MPDMLVKLYYIPDVDPVMVQMFTMDVQVRRAMAAEKHHILGWVQNEFNILHWTSECDVAFSRQPISCFIAVKDSAILGFACYDSTLKGFFGPTGVSEDARGFQIGRALLLTALHSMKQDGYGYAIIGAASDENSRFYKAVARATIIENSTPGVYAGILNV
ncbi:MAG: GNAT family N-acetyltransferase [Chloroflexi bacterium]|nr:GNAT family N-acetyltransferase [Chloroflexota bacterium]